MASSIPQTPMKASKSKGQQIRPEQLLGWFSILLSIGALAAVSWFAIQDLQPISAISVANLPTPTPSAVPPTLQLNTVHQRQGALIEPAQTSGSRTNPFTP